MNINLNNIKNFLEEHGDAIYLLDLQTFKNNFDELLAAFRKIYAQTHIAYSYKTNYLPVLCRHIDLWGGFAEVVSQLEYSLARHLQVKAKNIYYNGPYKQQESLNIALNEGACINIDSLAEFTKILNFTQKNMETSFNLGLRCNVDLENGKTSRFGIDVNGQDFSYIIDTIQNKSNLYLAGLHCHFPFRDLASFQARAKAMTELLHKLPFKDDLNYISFGGGFYGPLPESIIKNMPIAPPSFDDYAQCVGSVIQNFYGNKKKQPKLILEPGSALIANAMCLASKIISTKQVRHRNIATLATSTYNINPSVRGGQRPLQHISMTQESADKKRWDIVGYTCIEDDCICENYNGNLCEGDVIIIENIGSYGLVFKPPFIQPNIPVVDMETGEIYKRQENMQDIFATYTFT